MSCVGNVQGLESGVIPIPNSWDNHIEWHEGILHLVRTKVFRELTHGLPIQVIENLLLVILLREKLEPPHRTGRLVLISLLQSGLAVLATPHLAERGGNRVVQTLNLVRLKSRKGGAAAIPRHVAKGTSKPLCQNPGQWILLRTIAKPFFRLALRVSYRL